MARHPALRGLIALLALASVASAGTYARGAAAEEVLSLLLASGRWPWRPVRDPARAVARVGFARGVGIPAPGWRPLALARRRGSVDLPWGFVARRTPPARPTSAGIPEEVPLPFSGRAAVVPTVFDGVYGVLYGELSRAPVARPLWDRLRDDDPRLARDLDFEPAPGARFGVWVRRDAPPLPEADLRELFTALGDSPQGDRLLLFLGADDLTAPPEEAP